jgi:superfamily I DNA/RNA helicase
MRYIRSAAGLLPDRIDVRNYHHFARGYLHAKGRMSDKSILPINRRAPLIAQAVADVKQHDEENAFFSRQPKFFSDEIKWINGHNVASVAAYQEIRRAGRAAANLSRALRPLMWKIYERYRELRFAEGRQYDIDDIAAAVSATFDNDATPRLYKHIIIDEGQDLSPEMIRSLAKAVPLDGSVTFFGDVAQQIYGRGMSWRDAGLLPGAVWQFQQNYRNTLSIARLGLAISSMPYYAGEPDMVAPIFPTADGPKPALVSFNDENAEMRFIATLAQARSTTRSVAILLRTHAHIKKIRDYLPAAAIALKEDSSDWSADAGLYFGTYHAAKGLEFEVVLLPFLAEGELPSNEDIETDGEEEALAQDGRLLYVGVTRAKAEVILTHTGNVTPLLPQEEGLYNRVRK